MRWKMSENVPVQLVVAERAEQLSQTVHRLLVATVILLVGRARHLVVHEGDEMRDNSWNQLLPGPCSGTRDEMKMKVAPISC